MGRAIAVVVVTHDSAAHLGALLASVRAACRERTYRIVAVDNGSRDATPGMLEDEPDVTPVRQGNTGFAHGVNRGIERAPAGHDVLVLNPDVVLAADAVDRLLRVLDEEPDVGVVVPRLRAADGTLSPSLRRDPSALGTLVEAVVGGRRAGRFGESFRPVPGDGRLDVDWATGAVLLLRRELVDRVGLLDESFFLYSEETEYCLRAREVGFRIRCEPTAVATHTGGEMASNPTLWALRAVNRVRLYRRRAAPAAAVGFHLASLAFEARRSLLGDRPSRRAVRALWTLDLDAQADRLVRELGARIPVG